MFPLKPLSFSLKQTLPCLQEFRSVPVCMSRKQADASARDMFLVHRYIYMCGTTLPNPLLR